MRSIGVKQEKGRSPPFLRVEKKEQKRLETHYDNNKVLRHLSASTLRAVRRNL